MIYLDNNATTQLAPEVLQTMVEAMTSIWGNPSSVHSSGRAAKSALFLAKRQMAQQLGCNVQELTCTSGGTESMNLAIFGSVENLLSGHILSSTVEHAAVQKSVDRLANKGFCVEKLSPGITGMVEPKAVEKAIREDTKLIVLMAANNETGVLLNLKEIALIAERHNIALIVDAVALAGKSPVVFYKGISAMAFSAHKFHGPKGVGLLYHRMGTRLHPCILGGPQESGIRAGTENLVGILGMAKAFSLVEKAHFISEMERLRDLFEKRILQGCSAEINGTGKRLCNTSNIYFPNIDGEGLLFQLDMKGIQASLGSACSSGAIEPSKVLLAMGFSQERAMQSIRFSLSRYTTEQQVLQAADQVIAIVNTNSNSGIKSHQD